MKPSVLHFSQRHRSSSFWAPRQKKLVRGKRPSGSGQPLSAPFAFQPATRLSSEVPNAYKESSLHCNRERDPDPQVRTPLTHLTRYGPEEVKACYARACGQQAPDTNLGRVHGIPSGLLKGEISARDGRTAPEQAEGKLNLNDVAGLCVDGGIGLLLREDHIRGRCMGDSALALTIMSAAVACSTRQYASCVAGR